MVDLSKHFIDALRAQMSAHRKPVVGKAVFVAVDTSSLSKS